MRSGFGPGTKEWIWKEYGIRIRTRDGGMKMGRYDKDGNIQEGPENTERIQRYEKDGNIQEQW